MSLDELWAEEPSDVINRLFDERRGRTDSQILTELHALPVLPDEDDPAWDEPHTWHGHAYVYLALADSVRARRLRAGVPLLLERACSGDPGEIMRGLRHTLEAAYAPDYEALQPVCLAALISPQSGARRWAANELGLVGDAQALHALVARLEDDRKEVRGEVRHALARIGIREPSCHAPALAALQAQLRHAHDPHEVQDIQEACADLGVSTAGSCSL